MEVIGRPRHVIRTQVPQVLDLVGLAKKAGRFPDELSGGEQQRVSIARAFVNRPLIVLADEPTGNLDPATTVGIMRILDRINRTGTTDRDGHPRPAHRRRDAPARHRARPRHARPRPGARRLRRRELSQPDVDTHLGYFARETLVSLRRNLLMTIAGIAHRRGVARAVRRDHDALEVGRPRHRADQGRRRARDLHEGRTPPSSRSTTCAGALERRPADVKSYRYLDKEDAYEEFKRIFRNDPDLVKTSTAEALPDVVPGRARRRPSSPRRSKSEFETQPGVDDGRDAG